ncbi:MAG: NAD-dependent protein deacylase [Ruminococcaceae bacterium]|nr:NAD-dependent protein deacylase [Oscillospiraceae bacterium]
MKKEYINDINEIKAILRDADHAVFFGGAGMSTASGIPDFRGASGLYTVSDEPAEYFLSRECLVGEPERFFEFYREKMLYPDALPNEAHHALARLEAEGVIKAVITQNIDGLHQMAGSERVIELHGTVSRSFCDRCGRTFTPEAITEGERVPKCPYCGGVIRPDVTLYGEPLSSRAFSDAEEEIAASDVLIVGGSSLTVQPAASLVGDFSGDHLIIVNYSPTPYDGMAEYIIRESLTEVFEELVK